MKKSKDINNKPGVILFLGIVFALIGVAALVFGFIKNELFIKVVGIVFAFVGLLFSIVGTVKVLSHKKYKAVYNDPTAFETTAVFEKSAFSSYSSSTLSVGMVKVPTSVNVFKKIYYSYTDETGVKHTVKSFISYTPNQVEHLQKLGTFKIKCKGKISVIVENIPDENKYFNL